MLELGKKYSFETINPMILGTGYNDMKLVSQMQAEHAIKFSDVVTITQQLKSVGALDPNVDYRHMTYFLFVSSNNKEVIMADRWIDADTINTIDKINATFKIFDITTDDKDYILHLLKEKGYDPILELQVI